MRVCVCRWVGVFVPAVLLTLVLCLCSVCFFFFFRSVNHFVNHADEKFHPVQTVCCMLRSKQMLMEGL